VDDGSTDDTEVNVRRWGSDIRYVYQTNSGPAAARNRGIVEATGSLVAFLDTDDRWLPTKTEKQLTALHAYPEAALVSADMAVIDENGALLHASGFEKHRLIDELRQFSGKPIPDALPRLLRKNFINTSSVVVRKRVLEEVGGFSSSIRFGEDLELWARIAAHYPILTLTEVLEVRTEHGGNVTKDVESLLLDLVKVATKIREWGAGQLRTQGVDADRLVADAWGDLAYWYFSSDRLPEARQAFRRSVVEAFSLRSTFYAACCMLPPPVVRQLRLVKQEFAGFREKP
jgi:glycosyltransferase involved in cell wall biosynthesis